MRRQAGVGQRVGDRADQVGGREPVRGDVDAHRHSGPQRLPAGRGPAGLLQHPPVQLADQPDLLGQRHEGGRRQQPAPRVLPAHQRLGPVYVPAVQVDHRLEAQPELAPLQRVPQVGLQLGLGHHRPAHRRLELPHAGLAGGLRRIHRDVGVPQHVPGVAADLLDDADADRDPDRPPGELDRRAERVQQPAGGPQSGARGVVLDQHRELVPAEPGDHVVRPDRGDQPLGQPDQQPVAGLVPERVVDGLEPIQVEQQQGQPAAAAGHPLGPGHLGRQQGPVAEPGQRVRVSHPGLLGGERGVVERGEHLPGQQQHDHRDAAEHQAGTAQARPGHGGGDQGHRDRQVRQQHPGPHGPVVRAGERDRTARRRRRMHRRGRHEQEPHRPDQVERPTAVVLAPDQQADQRDPADRADRKPGADQQHRQQPAAAGSGRDEHHRRERDHRGERVGHAVLAGHPVAAGSGQRRGDDQRPAGHPERGADHEQVEAEPEQPAAVEPGRGQ